MSMQLNGLWRFFVLFRDQPAGDHYAWGTREEAREYGMQQSWEYEAVEGEAEITRHGEAAPELAELLGEREE